MLIWIFLLVMGLMQPEVNPERILMSSDRDGNWEIYTMLADGRNPRRLTDHPADDWYPAWSADGNEVVFASNRSGSFELYIMTINGTNIRQLTFTPTLNETAPAWSPDGTQIAYVASPINEPDRGEIYVIGVDEETSRQLTDNNVRDDFPSWSPDGESIVYQTQSDLYMMDADGENVRPLVLDGMVPSWSPNGNQIAFASDRTGNREIYLVNTDGSGIQQLTDAISVDSFPRWSDDSQRLIFGSNRDEETFELYMLTLADGAIQRLTSNTSNEGAPSLWGNTQVVLATQQPTAVLETPTPTVDPSTPTPLPICLISAPETVNLRAGPGTEYDRAGTLAGGTSTNADGQITGSDGFIWWRLTDGQWVRSDVVETAGECDALPKVELEN